MNPGLSVSLLGEGRSVKSEAIFKADGRRARRAVEADDRVAEQGAREVVTTNPIALVGQVPQVQ